METAYLGIGTNLGDRESNLAKAVAWWRNISVL